MSSFNFYSLVSAVKDTSSKALATLSTDLKEFSTTVQGDVAEAAKEVKKKVEATLAERSEQQTESVEVNGPNEETKSSNVTKTIFAFGSRLESVGAKLLSSADAFLDGWTGQETRTNAPEELTSGRRFRLLALQEASETYLDPPADFETFENWKLNLSVDDLHALQNEVLEHYPTVKEKLDALVPASIDSDSFWGHYLYKASLLAAQEQRGALLLEKVDNDEEDIAWDVESPTHSTSLSKDFAEEKPEMPLANAPRSSSEGASSQSEGWVALSEKKSEEVTQEDDDALDWGDDIPMDTTTVSTTEVPTDDWGQWE